MSYLEWWGESIQRQPRGSLEFSGQYQPGLRPLWLILLKWLGVWAMVAVGFGIALPSLLPLLPLWKAIAMSGGLMLIYCGLAFFCRPEPNMENLGWSAGFMDDPTQISDDINRSLWSLHCFLGPGRFVTSTLLETAAWAGIVPVPNSEPLATNGPDDAG
jgi:hypothetical protein